MQKKAEVGRNTVGDLVLLWLYFDSLVFAVRALFYT